MGKTKTSSKQEKKQEKETPLEEGFPFERENFDKIETPTGEKVTPMCANCHWYQTPAPAAPFSGGCGHKYQWAKKKLEEQQVATADEFCCSFHTHTSHGDFLNGLAKLSAKQLKASSTISEVILSYGIAIVKRSLDFLTDCTSKQLELVSTWSEDFASDKSTSASYDGKPVTKGSYWEVTTSDGKQFNATVIESNIESVTLRPDRHSQAEYGKRFSIEPDMFEEMVLPIEDGEDE